MPEHRIRFRGGWEASTVAARSGPSWLTLPIDWPVASAGTARLIRKFGRPRSIATGDNLGLELARVPGLVGLMFNGVSLPLTGPGPDTFFVPIADGLLERNELWLEVDLALASARAFPEGWGAIALVIGSGLSEAGSNCDNV